MHNKRSLIKKTLLLFGLLPLFSFSQFIDEDPRILHQFIVMLKPAHSVESLQEQFSEIKSIKTLSQRMKIYLLERNTTSSAEDFLKTLQHNEHIKLAQFNHRIKQRSLFPDDPSFNLQWNMFNTAQSAGIAGADIDAPQAWAIDSNAVTACGDTVVVAIIDGLFDLQHHDLNYFTNYNEIPGNGIDDDNNGYIDDVNGWNIYDTTGNVNNTGASADHSTHCAGIVGAIGNNNIGVAGVCWGAKILPVVGSSQNEAKVVAAYNYVREMRMLFNNTFGSKGAYVVAANSSFGVDKAFPSSYPIWCAMYDSMGAVGIISVAATANAGWNVDALGDIPTQCPSNYLITVTNTTNKDLKNSGAAYGKINIDLGAPGTSVYSTISGNSYGYKTGTSMASPHVAGAVAAMFSSACKSFCEKYYEQPDSMALLVRQYLLEGAEWNSSLNNITATNGRLNLYRAVMNIKKFNCDSCNFSVSDMIVPITCKNKTDGAISLSFSNGAAADYNILWSNGLSLPSLSDLPSGFYSATVTQTSTGCSRIITAALHNPDSIKINSITINPAVNGNPGNIIVNSAAGNEVLMYSLDSITYQQSPTLIIPDSGNYIVYIKNTSGCVIQQSVTVSGIDEFQNLDFSFQILPNPANNELKIYCLQFEKRKTRIEIFDTTGRKILETVPTSATAYLSASNFANGIYFLKIENISKKFTVLH